MLIFEKDNTLNIKFKGSAKTDIVFQKVNGNVSILPFTFEESEDTEDTEDTEGTSDTEEEQQ